MNYRLFLQGSLVSLVVALLASTLSGCAKYPQPIKSVPIQADSSAARRETVAELRSAWRTRVVSSDIRAKQAELRFLVRLASAVRKFENTESYSEVCRLWNDCLKEHLKRFPESA